jgi:hypothetical protein
MALDLQNQAKACPEAAEFLQVAPSMLDGMDRSPDHGRVTVGLEDMGRVEEA